MMPRHMPQDIGKSVVIKAYVDANHTEKFGNRRSHHGIIIYVNNTPIIWYSEHQNMVGFSSFGSEFVALRITTEIIEDF